MIPPARGTRLSRNSPSGVIIMANESENFLPGLVGAIVASYQAEPEIRHVDTGELPVADPDSEPN